MTTPPKNVLVAMIRRPGSINRYGQSNFETVESRVWVWMETRPTGVRNVNGDEVTIDATIVTDPGVNIQSMDEVTIDNVTKDSYTVFSADDDLDFLGIPSSRTARLVKKKNAT